MKKLFSVLLLTFLISSPVFSGNFRPLGFIKGVPTAGTAVQLIAISTLTGNMLIQAHPSNTGNIIVGDSTVIFASGNGVILTPGQAASFEDLYPNTGSNYYDLSEFYIDAATNGDSAIVTRMVSF